jgi:hypothetical protein
MVNTESDCNLIVFFDQNPPFYVFTFGLMWWNHAQSVAMEE